MSYGVDRLFKTPGITMRAEFETLDINVTALEY